MIEFFDEALDLTLKQLEAFYWVTQLGTFALAAAKLNATQSTVSARIQELEASLGVGLLDRTRQPTKPTARGRELIGMAERILSLSAQIRSTIGDLRSVSGVIRVGIAEFVAHSWLPSWVAAASRLYPSVRLEMDVDLTLTLIEKLGSGQVDLALLPGPLQDASVSQVSLGGVEFAWMASPSLNVPSGRLRAPDFRAFPILLLSEKSNLHSILKAWFDDSGSKARRVDVCNSLATVASLAVAGLGIAYLPVSFHKADLESGRLQRLDAHPVLPPLEYVCAYRRDFSEPLVPMLAKLATQASTFDAIPGQVNRATEAQR